MQRGDADQLSDAVAHDIECTLPESVPWAALTTGTSG
jgi:hypothetical protein